MMDRIWNAVFTVYFAGIPLTWSYMVAIADTDVEMVMAAIYGVFVAVVWPLVTLVVGWRWVLGI